MLKYQLDYIISAKKKKKIVGRSWQCLRGFRNGTLESNILFWNLLLASSMCILRWNLFYDISKGYLSSDPTNAAIGSLSSSSLLSPELFSLYVLLYKIINSEISTIIMQHLWNNENIFWCKKLEDLVSYFCLLNSKRFSH